MANRKRLTTFALLVALCSCARSHGIEHDAAIVRDAHLAPFDADVADGDARDADLIDASHMDGHIDPVDATVRRDADVFDATVRDAAIPRDASVRDASVRDAFVRDAFVVGDAGPDAARCEGDFVLEGTPLDLSGVGLTWFRDGAFRWPWPFASSLEQWMYVVAEDLESYERLPMEGLPLVESDGTTYGVATNAIDSVTGDMLVRLSNIAIPARTVVATYGPTGERTGGPLEIAEVGWFLHPNQFVATADGFEVVGVHDGDERCTSVLVPLGLPHSLDSFAMGAEALVPAFVRAVAWRRDHWVVWGEEDCESLPPPMALWDLEVDGTLHNRREVRGWSVGSARPRVDVREEGDWPILSVTQSGPTMTIEYARVDPDSGEITTPPTEIVRLSGGGLDDGLVHIDASSADEDAIFFSFLQGHLDGGQRFLRIAADGTVLQDTILSRSVFGSQVWLLEWVGDRWAVSVNGDIDELVCSD